MLYFVVMAEEKLLLLSTGDVDGSKPLIPLSMARLRHGFDLSSKCLQVPPAPTQHFAHLIMFICSEFVDFVLFTLLFVLHN